MITSTCFLPPLIMQSFNSTLLSTPFPGDNLQRLWRIYLYINKKLMQKSHHDPIWKKKCEQLEKEFLELYERTKTKEENIETKTKNKTKEPFYFIEIPNRSHQNIFEGLRYKN